MYKKYIKRLLDIIIASIALLMALPITLFIALAIKLDDGGPVFFKHKRYGQNKNPFTIYKFRTMKTTAPSNCPTNSLTNHQQHIMRSGKILRKLSLDELPQLLNVLQGHMSLVGPRPVILAETDLIAERDKYGANACKPGITGWAQVNGRDEVQTKRKAKMDGEYVYRLGFMMDLKCILHTVYAVFSLKGHREGVDKEAAAYFRKMQRQNYLDAANHPLVSVVIPVYNVQDYLEECFNTIANQTYRNIEIILVDDGSKDSSGKIADTLAQSESRATVIHKKNGGLSDARNAGMKIAKGKYITFIDSDDYIDKTFIESLVKLSEDTNADIAQCNNSRDPAKLSTGSSKHTAISGHDAFVELMKFKTISPTAWGKIYRLSLFRDNKLEFPVGRIHEDTAVLYKLIYLATKVVCLDKVLYYYRVNNNSIMTSSYTERHYGSVVKYHSELDDFILKNQINIEQSVIHRHKALRLLSVLNKLVMHKIEDTPAYNGFKKEYIRLSAKSHSTLCLLGVIPVLMPKIFRTTHNAMPIVRSLLGKT